MTGLYFTPQTMKSTLNLLGGPALPTQFITQIVPPTGMLGSSEFLSLLTNPTLAGSIQAFMSIAGSLILSVMTEKAAIPAKSFSTANIIRHGQHLMMPYGQHHETFKMTFICSNSMLERTYFDLWTQFIQKPNTHYMEYYDTYKTTIIIKKMSGSGGVDGFLADPGSSPTFNNPLVEAGSLLSTYYLEDAYPVSIGAQELSYADTSSYLTLDVEFAYSHMYCILDNLVPAVFGGPYDSITPWDAKLG
jgi:hypothetical protein